jgi:predicted ATPase/DNA-binding SARP family transcriptional activator
MLEVRLIGKFDIQYDGHPVILSSRAAQSLFAYLILTAGTLHRREKLAGMLWPEESEQKARTYLRNELWRIRKALPHTSKAEYFLADNLTVGFNQASAFWLDVAQLKNLSDPASAEELIEVLSSYPGELLPGFYEDWVGLEREHLQVLFEHKITCLLDMFKKEERWMDILEWAERWISFGQAPEAAYRALMIAYSGLGDHAKVTSTYERCKQVLLQLDLDPSEQTRALAFKRNPKINIPIPLTSFIGREKELEEVARLFSKSHLVTLTGSGGVGKTRLAIQVVAEILDLFPDGVWFLDLAPLNEPSLVPNTLASLLGLRELGELAVTELLISYFHSRTTLIIFDNCEHLIEASAQLINSLLTSCEHLAILATSRETLHVSGETPYRVPSLEIPKPDTEVTVDKLSRIESVRLFIERAAFASLGFIVNSQNIITIAQICQRLDGIPLALELAAARVNVLTVEQLLKHLDNRFKLLTNGSRSALPRHQTLRATIEWSYDLLSEQERILFRRLAVFMGGWTLGATEEVCTENGIESGDILDLLSRLVNKSLVMVETSSGEDGYPIGESLRYRMLETMRQFACEKLAGSGEEEQFRARHLDYFLKLAQKAEPKLYGAGQTEWMQKLDDEHENMRAALQWALQGDETAGQQLAAALWWNWYLGRNPHEVEKWLEKMLAVNPGVETFIRAKLLSAAGWLAFHFGFFEQAKMLAGESLALFRKLNYKVETVNPTPLATLGFIAYFQFDYNHAFQLLNESLSLCKRAGNKWGVSHALGLLGYVAQGQGDFEKAQKFYQESLLVSKEIGDKEHIGWILYLMAGLAISQGNNTQATKLCEEALQIYKGVKTKHIGWILNVMGVAAISSENYERGRVLLEEGMELCRSIGDQEGMAYSLQWRGWIARLQGDFLKARSLYCESLHWLQRIEIPGSVAKCLIHIGQLLGAQGSPEKFAHFLGMAEGVAPDIEKMLYPVVRAETERFVEIARAVIGDKAYVVAWEAGRQTSLEEAFALGLNALQ